jgi:hypothetical protein
VPMRGHPTHLVAVAVEFVQLRPQAPSGEHRVRRRSIVCDG